MATKFNKRKKNLLALFLSLVMVSSAAVSFAACNDEDDTPTDDDTTTSTTETDTARINNGSFEYGMDKDDATTLIYTSMTGWSKDSTAASTGSAASSVAASGIIDTEEKAWANLTKSALSDDVGEITTAEDAKNYWDQMSAFDKLTFYDKWEEGDHDEDVEDLDFYDADTDDFNIDIDKVPDFEVNPGVHEGAKEGDTHVFMIHNKRTNGLGTAQKYASSTTVTVAAGTSATFSVWVKTADLTFNDGSPVNGKMGAYIGVTHTVGGKTLDQFQVKNIDTDEWVQYEFYLRGSSYASSTFTIVLGLGQGGGTQVKEYVQGYAFFDDVTCELIDNDTYEEKTKDIGENETVTLSDTGSEKYMLADDTQNGKTKFAIDLYAGFNDHTPTISTALTEEKDGGKTYVSGTGKYNTSGYPVYPTLGSGFSTDNDVVGLFSKAALTDEAKTNTYLENRLVKDFGYDTETKTFGEKYTKLFGTSDVLMFLSVKGASYTAKITDEAFTLNQGDRMAISFFLKTSDLKGRTGVTVTARNNADQSDTSVLSSLTTTDITLVDLEEGQKDIFDGWQQCFVFVENDTERKAPISFTLEINYGPTSVKSDKTSYYAGYAAITNFQIAEMDEEEYSYISTGTYATSLSLKDPDEKTTTGVKFDSAAVVPSAAIETGLAQLRNYTGVYADSGYVSANGTNDKKNDDKAYAGLFSKDYLDAYAENTDADYWLNVIAASKGISADNTAAKKDLLTTLLGESVDAATQPLVIVNNEDRAYGFLGAKTTLSTGSYATVSYRVKVSEGATATIYLTDTDDLTHESVISIGRQVSYWYDKDGNVCVSDPTVDGFNSKTDVAFELQDNGLYTWNKNCDEVGGVEGKYYANLANYERVTDDAGNVNLVVAEGGVQYNYNSDWNNEGMDGIAFYGNTDGTKFYSDRARTIEVLDFNVTDLAPRYTAVSENGQQLAVEIVGTEENADKWQTVTFQLHAGTTEKNYRVEFWSGNREGKTSAKDTYVLFDINSIATSTAETWESRMNGVFDKIKDAYDYADEDELKAKYDGIIYNAYSFYDSASFLRYNADLDENEVTNSYDDYNPTNEALYYELVSYLRYADENSVTVFVDYAQNDVMVEPDLDNGGADDDNNDDDTPAVTDGGTNVWLLISSIVIAVALIVAVIGLILKKVVEKARREKARQLAANPTSVRTPTKVKKVKAAKPAKKDEPKDDGDPYND